MPYSIYVLLVACLVPLCASLNEISARIIQQGGLSPEDDVQAPTRQACDSPSQLFDLPGRFCSGDDCFNSNIGYDSFPDAWTTCGGLADCTYIMRNPLDGYYYLRRAEDPSNGTLPNTVMAYGCNRDVSPMAKASRLASLKPLFYIHVPKCGGTAWINVLVHHPDICPGMPEDVFVEDAEEQEENGPNPDDSILSRTMSCMNEENCPDSLASGFRSTAHISIVNYDQYMNTQGHGTIMIRQPEQRILSDYYYMPLERLGLTDIMDFAPAAAGIAVKLLTRPTQSFSVSDYHIQAYFEPPPSADERDIAILRLGRDFPFVGLTEEFNSSVCLFHAMFGGPCHDFEFEAVERHGEYDFKNESGYDVSLLNGFRDEYDGPLYDVATEIFNANLRAYGVDQSTCPSSCVIDN